VIGTYSTPTAAEPCMVMQLRRPHGGGWGTRDWSRAWCSSAA